MAPAWSESVMRTETILLITGYIPRHIDWNIEYTKNMEWVDGWMGEWMDRRLFEE